MRAWVLPELGGPERYRLEDLDAPQPGDGEVRVQVRAAALNHMDLWVSRGLPAPPLPHVPGADGAGVVEAVGEGVTGVAVGDEVVLDPSISCGACPACTRGEIPLCPDFEIMGEHRWGSMADLVVVPAVNAVPKPPGLGWEEAAAYGLAGATAFRMLRRARLAPGDVMLVVGVGGGVSSAGMLLGLAWGATVYVTSRSGEKRRRALELGAGGAFDSSGRFARELRAATGGRGADVVFENVGPATWEQATRSLAPGGRLVTCGGTSGQEVSVRLPVLFFKQHEIIGSTMSDHDEFRRVTRLVGDGRVPVLVDEVLPFDAYPAALERLQAGQQLGKLVIRHDDAPPSRAAAGRPA